MNTLLAQAPAIKLPNAEGTPVPIPYPTEMQSFIFASKSLGDIISRAVLFVLAFAGIGLLLMLLASGFEYLTSAGDAKKLEGAKQRLTYSIVGFLLIFTAFWLVQIAGNIFGLTEVNTIFK